jgi:hypothetical protein
MIWKLPFEGEECIKEVLHELEDYIAKGPVHEQYILEKIENGKGSEAIDSSFKFIYPLLLSKIAESEGYAHLKGVKADYILKPNFSIKERNEYIDDIITFEKLVKTFADMGKNFTLYGGIHPERVHDFIHQTLRSNSEALIGNDDCSDEELDNLASKIIIELYENEEI